MGGGGHSIISLVATFAKIFSFPRTSLFLMKHFRLLHYLNSAFNFLSWCSLPYQEYSSHPPSTITSSPHLPLRAYPFSILPPPLLPHQPPHLPLLLRGLHFTLGTWRAELHLTTLIKRGLRKVEHGIRSDSTPGKPLQTKTGTPGYTIIRQKVNTKEWKEKDR